MAHDAAKSVYLAHEIALCQTAYRGIAAQTPYRIKRLGHHQRGEALTRRGACSLYACMSTSDDDYVVVPQRYSLPKTEL